MKNIDIKELANRYITEMNKTIQEDMVNSQAMDEILTAFGDLLEAIENYEGPPQFIDRTFGNIGREMFEEIAMGQTPDIEHVRQELSGLSDKFANPLPPPNPRAAPLPKPPKQIPQGHLFPKGAPTTPENKFPNSQSPKAM